MWSSYRLSRAEIEFVVKNGKNSHFSSFSLKYTYFSSNTKPKVAFVASKKIFKTAVERNKAKRRAREAFRRVVLDSKPYFMVFFLKKVILDIPFKSLESEFAQAIKKCNQ